MSDEVLTVQLTAREIDLIHQCIGTNIETVKRRHDPTDPMISELIQELGELSDDLLEQRFRPGDWTEDVEPTEIAEGFSFSVAEDHMIQAGIEAREQSKASSRAAERRALNFSGARDDGDLSETQKHDLWLKPNNGPADW